MADPIVNTAKTPWHIWVVGVVSLIWNSVGAMDFVMTQTKNTAYMNSLTQAQLDFYYGFPIWVVATWAIAVWGGVLGSLTLLLRKSLAVYFFLSSFVCIILTDIHNFVLANGLNVMGGAVALVISATVLLIGALLWFYALAMRKRGVLK
jgi:hypothetical protein